MPIQTATPNFENGFAPRDGEPAYPSLCSGLVGYWDPTLGVTGIMVPDVSQRGKTGTNVGVAVQGSEFGPLWKFARIDNQLISLPAMFNGLMSFSVSLWTLFTGAPSANEYSLITNWIAGSQQIILQYDQSAGKLLYFTNADATRGGLVDNTDIDDGEWHHIVATYDGADMRVYVDGIVSPTTFAQTGPIDSVTNTTYIGNYRVRPTVDEYDGFISNVAIYNRTLTATEKRLLLQDRSAITRLAEVKTGVKTPAAPGVGNPWYQYAQEAAVAG